MVNLEEVCATIKKYANNEPPGGLVMDFKDLLRDIKLWKCRKVASKIFFSTLFYFIFIRMYRHIVR